MKTIEKQHVWIRVAGHSSNIKDKKPHGWRCYIDDDPKEILLQKWYIVSGEPSKENIIPAFNADKDEHGLIAWIDFWCSYAIKDDVLYITLASTAS